MVSTLTELYPYAEKQMQSALFHLEKSLVKLRVGKASPQMLEQITVDYYGNLTPLDQVANISTLDAKTISIQPWEKNMIAPIEKAIMAANIGLTPQNDGMIIRISIPPLTEERRKELVKRCYSEGEQACVSIRNFRREAMDNLKSLQQEESLSEDGVKESEAEIQKITNTHTDKVSEYIAKKEKEIMTV